MPMLRLIIACLALLALAPARAEPLRILAAASLSEAMNELADRYASRGHARPVVALAASSALARQIERGARADIFVSADEQWMDYLAERKLIAPHTRRLLASNRLVLVVPATQPTRIAIRPGFAMARLIGEGRWTTGDPETVPAGRYAKAALIELKVWPSVASRLARAENVRAALAFVERGAAAAGIVYATDALASRRVSIAGVFPAWSHPPIRYPVAAIGTPSVAARDFLAFLRSPVARAVLGRHGFVVPR